MGDVDLDNPTWASLTSTHADLAIGSGPARRYPPNVSIFGGVRDDSDQSWAALGDLVDDGGFIALAGGPPPPPDSGLAVAFEVHALRFVLRELLDDRPEHPVEHPDIVELEPADAPEMLALAELAQPGPFAIDTPKLGTYLGVRDDRDRLVAMAGERLRPAGATEISGVSTHPDARRRGLARALTVALVQRILDRGELPFLHTTPENIGAQRVYERIGFERTGTMAFRGVTRS